MGEPKTKQKIPITLLSLLGPLILVVSICVDACHPSDDLQAMYMLIQIFFLQQSEDPSLAIVACNQNPNQLLLLNLQILNYFLGSELIDFRVALENLHLEQGLNPWQPAGHIVLWLLHHQCQCPCKWYQNHLLLPNLQIYCLISWVCS